MKSIYCFILLFHLFHFSFAQTSLKWIKQIGGTDQDYLSSMQISSDNYLFTMGTFTGTVDVDPGPGIHQLNSKGNSDIFIAKLDSNGNFIWAKQIGGIDQEYSSILKLDDSNNIYLCGVFGDTVDFDPGISKYFLQTEFFDSYFVLKLDKDGNFIWVKQFDNIKRLNISVASNKTLYLTAYFHDSVDVDPGLGLFKLTSNGDYDSFVLHLNSNGDFIWVKQIGGKSINWAQSSKLDNQSNILISGHFTDTTDFDPGIGIFNLFSENGYVFLLKLDSSGNFVWAKNYGAKIGTNGGAIGGFVAIDDEDFIYIEGYYQGIIDMDPSPSVLQLISKGQHDVFVCKLDSNGNLIWAKSIGSKNDDPFGLPTVDSKGNIYVTGGFRDTIDMDPSASVHNLFCNVPNGIDVIAFILKLDSAGNFMWAQQLGYNNSSAAWVLPDNADNLYVYGTFTKTCDFDGSPAIHNLTSNGKSDAFIAKYELLSTPIPIDSSKENVILYPNPASNKSYLSFTSSGQKNYTVAVYSIDGKILNHQAAQSIVGENKISIDMNLYAKGMYFVHFKLGEQVVRTFKLLKD